MNSHNKHTVSARAWFFLHVCGLRKPGAAGLKLRRAERLIPSGSKHLREEHHIEAILSLGTEFALKGATV